MFFCFLCWFVLGLGICPSWELSHTGPPGWLPHLRIGSRMCPSQSLLRSLTRINTSQCSGRHRWQAVNFAQRPENISKALHYCWPHCCHCPLQNGAWLTNVIKKNPCQIHVKLERRSSLLSDGSPDLLLVEAMIEGLPYRLFFPAKGMRLNFSLTAIRISALFFQQGVLFHFPDVTHCCFSASSEKEQIATLLCLRDGKASSLITIGLPSQQLLIQLCSHKRT